MAGLLNAEEQIAGHVTSHPATVRWACGALFFSFLQISAVARQLGIRADGGGSDGSDADVDEQPTGVNGAASVEQLQASVAARRGSLTYAFRAVDAAVEGSDDAASTRERWGIVRHFFHMFLEEPVVGAFAGLDRPAVRDLAQQLIVSSSTSERLSAAGAVESVAIVWPFLRLVGNADDADPLLLCAIGELLLFTDSVDTLWETTWRSLASPVSLAIEADWKDASVEQSSAWASVQPSTVVLSPLLSASRFSVRKAVAQALETRPGRVFPDLDAVGPYITDAKTDKVNADRAAKAAAGPNALERELDRVLGAGDCRHAYITSDVFTFGVENFLCRCVLLVGFDFLVEAESPAHALATLVQRVPLLPSVVLFYTAVQIARSAQRRLPWLLNASRCHCFVDRLHNVGDKHK